MTYSEWLGKYAPGSFHAHCANNDCEHPQPFVDGEQLRCGACGGPMVPCVEGEGVCA